MPIAGAVCSHPTVAETYEWKVENFFSLSETLGDYYHSPDIQFSGRTFQFRLHPNNWDWGSDDYIDLHLLLKTPSPPITVLYTLGIKTAAGATEVLTSGICEFSTSYAFVNCEDMKRSELLNRRQELAPGDALTFKARLMIDDVSRRDIGTTDVAVQTSVEDAGGQEASGERQELEKPDFVTLAHSLKELYVGGKDCDVTLEVKDKKFRAHKLILGARTPVLAAMFSHNTTEAETGIVRVEDCDPEAFEVFLRFVYSDETENLTRQNVTNVYYVADKYNLPGLKKECVRHMLSNLTASTVCNTISLAERHGEELLQAKATEFFLENPLEIFRTASWRRFMVENSNLANDLIILQCENSK